MLNKIKDRRALAHSTLEGIADDSEAELDLYKAAFSILDEALNEAIDILEGRLESRIREKFATPTDCTLFTFIDGNKVHFKVFASAHLNTVIRSGIFDI